MGIVLLVFVLCLLIQVLFIHFLDQGFVRTRPVKGELFPPVSVVLAARNEAINLTMLLPDLLSQQYPDYEIIVVDNQSEDNTQEVLSEYLHDSRIRYVKSGTPPEGRDPKKWALENGIKNACNEHLLFTDADVRIKSPFWIKEMAAGFSQNYEIVLGVSPYEKKGGILNLFIRYETLFTAFQYIGFALIGRPYMGVGRNLGYKKSLFDTKGGFSMLETITGGDDDLFVNAHANSKNTAVVLGEESLVVSYPKTSWSEFIRQKTRHLSVGKHYRSRDQWILGMFLISQFLVWALGIYLLAIGFVPILILFAWTVRFLIFVPAFYRSLKRIGISFEWQYLIFLDFVYPLYYLSVSFWVLRSKKITWKTKDNFQKKHSKISG